MKTMMIDTVVWLLASVSIAVEALRVWDVKLVNGSTEMEGIPWFYFGDGEWRPLCDEHIKPEVAATICRQLKLPTTMVTTNSAYNGNWSRLFGSCFDYGQRALYRCSWAAFPNDKSCPGSKGIRCGGNIRFVGGEFIEGQVQVYEGGTWHAFCKADAGYALANVACNQMGLNFYRLTAAAIRGLAYISTINGSRSITCVGNETRLDQCVIEAVDETCPPEDTYIVTCNATLIEIMPSENAPKEDCDSISHLNRSTQHTLQQRCVEENNAFALDIIHSDASGYWCGPRVLTELEQSERNKMASVACFELGFSRYDFKIFITDYKEESFRIAPGQLICTGREDNLTSCTRHTDLGSEPCDNETDDYFSLFCKSRVQLDAGDGSSGLLSLQDQTTGVFHWVHVANAEYGLAELVCRELGYNSYDDTSRSANSGLVSAELLGHIPGRTILGTRIACSGEENLLRDCYYTQDDSLVAGDHNSVLGIDCDAQDTNVEMLNVSFPSRGLLMMNATRDSTMTYVCAYDLNADERSKLAAVLCHQVGFSRFGADLIVNDTDTLILNGATTTSGFIDVRWRCLGKENKISECLLYRAPEITNCSTAFSLSCQNNTYCETEHDYVQPKSIMCHKKNCFKDCDTYEPEECDLRKSACYIYSTSKAGVRTDESTHCQYCRPRSYDESIRMQQSCCYSNWCNVVDQGVLPIHYQYRLTGDFLLWHENRLQGFLPYDGYVQVMRSGEWIYLAGDANYSATYLNWLCTRTGHYTSDATRLPLNRTAEKCMRVSDEETCVANNDLNGTCVEEIGECNGPVLNLRCNAILAFTRLADGGSPQMGRVEVSYNGEWGTICTQGFTLATVGVVCRSLGYSGGCGRSSVTDPAVRFRPGEGIIHFTNIRCEGWEPNIWKCKMDLATSCSHGEDLHIICPEAPMHPTLPPTTVRNDTGLFSGNSTSSNATQTENEQKGIYDTLHCPDQQCDTFPCEFIKECRETKRPSYCSVTKTTLRNGDPSFSFQCRTECNNGILRDNVTGVNLHSLNSTLCCATTNCTRELLYLRNDTDTDDVGTQSSGYRHSGRDPLGGVVIMSLLWVLTFTMCSAR